MKKTLLALSLLLLLPNGCQAQTSIECAGSAPPPAEMRKEIPQDNPKPVEVESQTKIEKVKEWAKEAAHPVVIAAKPLTYTLKKSYAWTHKHVLEPINRWGDSHSGLINVSSACANFGVNAILGAKKL